MWAVKPGGWDWLEAGSWHGKVQKIPLLFMAVLAPQEHLPWRVYLGLQEHEEVTRSAMLQEAWGMPDGDGSGKQG